MRNNGKIPDKSISGRKTSAAKSDNVAESGMASRNALNGKHKTGKNSDSVSGENLKAEKMLNKRVNDRIKADEKYENYKRNRAKRRKRAAFLRRVTAVVLASVIFLFCIFNLNYLTPAKMTEHFKAVFADSGRGKGFPYKFDTKDVLNFSSFADKDFAVLTEDTLLILNHTAKPVLRFTHAMANPIIKYSMDRILLYDQGGTKAYILNQSGKVLTFSIKNNIVCADISNNGKTVIVTDSTSKLKKDVTVYARNGKKTFKWTNGSGYIIDSAMNSDGSILALGLIDTVDAEETSTVLSFNLKTAQQKGHRQYKGSSLCSISFIGSSDIALMCSDKIAVLNSKCELKAENELPSANNYQLFCDKRGHIINLYSPYNNGKYIVDVYDSSLKNIYEKNCSSEVLRVYSDGSSLATLYRADKVELNMIGGKVTYSAKYSSDYYLLSCKRKNVYLCGNGVITKLKVKKQ